MIVNVFWIDGQDNWENVLREKNFVQHAMFVACPESGSPWWEHNLHSDALADKAGCISCSGVAVFVRRLAHVA
jgi:hypothetical protein